MNIEKLNDYFTSQIAACAVEEKRLAGQERKDEAVFAKIRGNVFDIFRTVLAAGVKAVGEEKAVDFLREKLDTIPKSWQTAKAQAETHGQVEKAHIEGVKLDAVREIREAIEKIWREEA